MCMIQLKTRYYKHYQFTLFILVCGCLSTISFLLLQTMHSCWDDFPDGLGSISSRKGIHIDEQQKIELSMEMIN